MTAFTPGSAQRLALLDLGACYPAGTVVWVNGQAYFSASWPGNYKLADLYLIAGSSLADLAVNEAAVAAGGTGYLYHAVHIITMDSTSGSELHYNSTNHNLSALSATSRYVSIFVIPQFNAVPWYTNDLSVLTLGATGVGGASSVSCPVVAPVADFSATPTTGIAGDTITFVDLSANTPTSWAWTFGDGGTSTAQNPTHVYASAGDFTVSLTATNASGSDTETKSEYISMLAVGTPDPPVPAGVLLEIYAASPGAARWDVAQWDVGQWSASTWQDVTPYGIEVALSWGSNKPERGILVTPDAASWAIDYYDPGRILDPSNEDGPYFGDLIPGLPIRISHRERVIRVGYATGISHSYAVTGARGYMRGADNITVLANADVPSDTTLPNTLYARAVAAIAAAGLDVQVRAPIGADPPVTAWATGTREWTVWEWIKDAAQEVLHIPIIDSDGFVTFRPWASPLVRGRSVGSPELIGLQVLSNYEGLYSVVQARQDVSTIIERALTPPPRYGARTVTRDEVTIAPAAWAETVLADRAFPSNRWAPGDIYPLTADSVENLATIEAIERISMAYPEEGIFVTGIVVGGEVDIKGKKDGEALWRFQFYTAQTADEPLIETGGDPTDYLLATGGAEYLYPTS